MMYFISIKLIYKNKLNKCLRVFFITSLSYLNELVKLKQFINKLIQERKTKSYESKGKRTAL